jgi:hypothetical protein
MVNNGVVAVAYVGGGGGGGGKQWMDTNPGPIDGSVLYDQDKHVSSAVWDGQVGVCVET